MALAPQEERKLALYQELVRLVGAERRRRCEHDLGLFISTYLGSLTPNRRPAFHQEMVGLLGRTGGGGGTPPGTPGPLAAKPPDFLAGNPKAPVDSTSGVLPDGSINRLLFIAPRGFAKSTVCTVMFTLWLAAYGRKRDIFLVSSTIALAKEMLRKVRDEIEANPRLLQDFGPLRSDKWTEEYVALTNGVRIMAKGRGFQIRGFRPDLIVCDDLEDEEVIYSKEQREKLEHWFLRTLLPTLKPNQDLVYVGTQLHQLSLIAKLERKEEFVSRRWQALTDGRSIWEDLWPTETLLRLRREMGEYAFLAEFQNQPISLQDQPVKPHMVEGVGVQGVPVAACLAIDPAISERTSSDERAFVLFAKCVDPETGKLTGFREIYSEKGRWGIHEQLDRIIDLYVRYEKVFEGCVFRVIFESVAFQKVYGTLLADRARERGLWIPVAEAEIGMGDSSKRPKDKFTRLMQVVHLFEQRFVQVLNPDLAAELTVFPNGDADNLVDAAVYALYWLMQFRSGSFVQKSPAPRAVTGREALTVREIRPGVFVADGSPPPERRAASPFRRLINFGKS